MLKISNVFYNGTVIDGIKGFFKIYNPEYGAHETHITADYPMCNPIKNLVGIEFILKYLEFVNYENIFCRLFSPVDIHHLLCGYDEAYKDLVFNIYEPVLIAAIGCILTNSDIYRLTITETGILYLNNLLKDKSNDEISKILLMAFNELKNKFSLENDLLEQYIKTSLYVISPKINTAIEQKNLNSVFLIAKYPENKPKLYFSYGEKMDNEVYRKIVEEIMQCTSLSDKISIIKNEIHSLSNLEDILLDAELSAHEVMGILHELELPEIAALSKKHPFHPIIEHEVREQEQLLCKCLHDVIASLPEQQKQ